MKKFTKVLCVAICVLLCASVLFSVGSAIYNHNHDCIGEDCLYCQVVSLQQELMRLVLLSYFSASFALIFVQLIMNINSRGDDEKQSINLVANKVKLTA
jgi:hypothetical protein